MKKQFYLAKMVLFFVVLTGSVKTLAQCSTVASMTPGAVTCSTAAFSWAPVSGAMGYEYVLDMSMTDPSGSGTMVMTTSGSQSGLTASTTYNLHVRAICMGGYSPWATVGTVGTPACITCTTPASITTTPAPHGVTLTWAAVTGALGYEYVVNTTMVDPSGSGTLVTTAGATVSGLIASTMYYVHTRTKCGASTFSPWSTAQSFSTSSAASISNVNENNRVSINAYPNPVNSTLTLEVSEGSLDAIAQIIGIDGRTVKTVKLIGQVTNIDISSFSNGFYFVKYSDSQNTQTIKINKQ